MFSNHGIFTFSYQDAQRPPNKRRKRKGSNSGSGANSAPPVPNKKRSPGPNFSLASQVVVSFYKTKCRNSEKHTGRREVSVILLKRPHYFRKIVAVYQRLLWNINI